MKRVSYPMLLAVSLVFAFGFIHTPRSSAQTVEKLADLFAGQDQNGDGYGPNTPQCRFTVVGTNLWFTSNSGGKDGSGGVFSFDLSNSNVTQLATLDNNTGKTPWASSIVIANGKGWFTTSLGGAGNKGSLCSIDLTNHVVSNVYSFPTAVDYGGNPRSTPVLIGDELWFTTSAGGLPSDGSAGFGTIVKYNLTSGFLSNMFSLILTNTGRQPLGCSLVQVSNSIHGNAYYYLTLAGGTNTGSGTGNGAGILGKLTFDEDNQPALTNAAHLPGGNAALPAGDPVFDGGDYLYFTAVGAGTTGGALVRFNLTSSELTSVFTFGANNTATATNVGYRPYGTPVLYNGELYLTTMGGGTQGRGVLGKFTLSNSVFTKLVDLDGNTGLALGANPQYNGGTVYTNPVDGRIGIFFPINKGGLYNFGSILRVNMPPPPIVTALAQNNDGTVQLNWAGGYSPFQVDVKLSSVAETWTTNWLGSLTTNSVSLPATNDAAFFRVSGASQ